MSLVGTGRPSTVRLATSTTESGSARHQEADAELMPSGDMRDLTRSADYG
jgi:hypothetical protein